VEVSVFWDIIDTARESSGQGKPFDQALAGYLATRSLQDILEYQQRSDEMHAALYRWDVWAAAYLIGGGCSDDSFIDFRAGLIAQGRDWYQRVAASPDSLAGHPAVADAPNHSHGGPLFYELVNYAAPDAFERVTGGKDSFYDAWNRYRGLRGHRDPSPADMGEDFDFDDAQEMRRRLPRLSALYLRNAST
jgi:Protein of unknown function (DUF4240)